MLLYHYNVAISHILDVTNANNDTNNEARVTVCHVAARRIDISCVIYQASLASLSTMRVYQASLASLSTMPVYSRI